MTQDQSSPHECEQPKRDHSGIKIKALSNLYDSATNVNTVCVSVCVGGGRGYSPISSTVRLIALSGQHSWTSSYVWMSDNRSSGTHQHSAWYTYTVKPVLRDQSPGRPL